MRMDRFQWLALSTTGATYVLIGVGGLVRAAGAGLGCPDWPKCFDRWIPPTDASGVPAHMDPELFNFALAWTEYINRLLGVVVGLLILATTGAALWLHRRNRRVSVPTVAALVGVLFQGWLGGQVVESGLRPAILTAHLILALVIVSLLLYATVSAFFPPERPRPSLTARRRRWVWATWGAWLAVAIQVGLGAGVRSQIQEAAELGLSRDQWIVAVGAVEGWHRWAAAGVSLLLVGLWLGGQSQLERDRWLRNLSGFGLALLAIQVAAGYGMATFSVPPALQFVHLWAASLLMGVLTLQVLLLLRLDPREAEAARRR